MQDLKGEVVDHELVVEALYGPAWMLGGSKLGDDVLRDLARSEFPERPFCVVRQWMLLDIMLSDAEEHRILCEGLQPTVLFANHIVQCSQLPSASGKGTITGYQKSFESCFFETQKTLFILAGPGSRKHIGWPSYAALINPHIWSKKGLVSYD